MAAITVSLPAIESKLDELLAESKKQTALLQQIATSTGRASRLVLTLGSAQPQ